jgi:hypothetical protein
MIFGSNNPARDWESIKAIADSVMVNTRQVEHEWPKTGVSCVVSLDVAGKNAAMWMAVGEPQGQISGAIVHLVHVNEHWNVNSVLSLEEFSPKKKSTKGQLVHSWASLISFRVGEPIGAAIVWGIARSTVNEVEFGIGFGISEPRKRHVEPGTGCFLLLQEVDQDAASIFQACLKAEEKASQPLLRIWANDGSMILVGYDVPRLD